MKLHESQISKARKISGYVLSILPSLMIVFSGSNKILGIEWMVEAMKRIPHIGEMTLFIGMLEIACVIIYWIPRVSNIGFFLLCSYTGGIIVAEIVANYSPLPGIMLAIFLYTGTMLRKPSLSGLKL
ncbi:DoxX family protein [Aureibacter tunicatorum]|uniref:DoxX-like protein n=1 Tax=Aureibacter tunicatorum TaxID=866807 RepID=A0AAE3XST8_9BACT|nr:DoxX family protein [Aureibacter tunicatorum]MDR6241379.1 hypothetical protein [Aureibacter tunicatorum]BDD06776.1 hypothetical protein AUTU_42590 [Aureibacter tunicatorum]